jgi:hypothetical protein
MTLPRTAADVLADHVLFDLDCIDRMYLNVYVPQLQRELGLIGYLRGQLGCPVGSTAPLAPITEGFNAAVRRYARDRGVPVVDFVKGQRKDDVMHEYLAAHTAAGGGEGVLFIGRAQENFSVRNSRVFGLPCDRSGLLRLRGLRTLRLRPRHLALRGCPNQGVFIALLVIFEAGVGALILSGGRRTRVGLVGAMLMHVGLLPFGWVLIAWSIVMLVALVQLLLAERNAPTTPTSLRRPSSNHFGHVRAWQVQTCVARRSESSWSRTGFSWIAAAAGGAYLGRADWWPTITIVAASCRLLACCSTSASGGSSGTPSALLLP